MLIDADVPQNPSETLEIIFKLANTLLPLRALRSQDICDFYLAGVEKLVVKSGKCDHVLTGLLMSLLRGALRFDPESRLAHFFIKAFFRSHVLSVIKLAGRRQKKCCGLLVV